LLPAAYNFTFVAGVLLAARLGARLHLSAGSHRVLDDAARLASSADRLIVLANPVILDQAAPTAALPASVLVDSGGAPLSITGISDFRARGVDVREGYGLTETASLTHFDTEATAASLGTVGTAMPGVHATVTTRDGKPVIELSGPATGIPLDPGEALPAGSLRTTDLGASDGHGRLRLLGRTDDQQISGMWPRDTLDALGPLLGRRCALVRHQHDRATVRLLSAVTPTPRPPCAPAQPTCSASRPKMSPSPSTVPRRSCTQQKSLAAPPPAKCFPDDQSTRADLEHLGQER
jgi:hypothetical protein